MKRGQLLPFTFKKQELGARRQESEFKNQNIQYKVLRNNLDAAISLTVK